MDKKQAEQEAAAHELAAKRNPRKFQSHMLAARLIREQANIPAPEPFLSEITSRNAEAQRAEAERIRKWKESR